MVFNTFFNMVAQKYRMTIFVNLFKFRISPGNVLLTAGNALILRSIFVTKELQTPTNLFLASKAVTDLLITLFLPMDTVSIPFA